MTGSDLAPRETPTRSFSPGWMTSFVASRPTSTSARASATCGTATSVADLPVSTIDAPPPRPQHGRPGGHLQVPDVILDGLAARPDDPGVWQVLTDFLLENGAPGASLAMCELELMKGISNPDLLEELARARDQRPALPKEPYGGYPALWRCGFVVRLTLRRSDLKDPITELLRAPAVQGLHMLSLVDEMDRWDGLGRVMETADRFLAEALEACPPRLRRLFIDFNKRGSPLSGPQQRLFLATLTRLLPPSVQRVDLVFGALHRDAHAPLLELASRVERLNLDGTRLAKEPTFLRELLDAGTHVYLGGTGLALDDVTDTPVEWLAPEVAAWVERHDTQEVVPLTPSLTPDGYASPGWPQLQGTLTRDLMGWSVGAQPVGTGSRFRVVDVEATLRVR